MMGEFLTIAVLEDGVVLELTKYGREELEDGADLYDLMEDIVCNSEWEFVNLVNTGYYLTDDSRFGLSNTVIRDDHGDIVYIDSVYEYEDDYIISPLSVLEEDGSVAFKRKSLGERWGPFKEEKDEEKRMLLALDKRCFLSTPSVPTIVSGRR